MFRKLNLEKIKLLGNISFWIFLIVCLAIVTRYIKAYRSDSPRFILNEVKIKFDDGKIITDDKAFSYLGLEKGSSIFKINPTQFSKKILRRHPEILEIHVYKKIPAFLELDVKNRKSVAQIHLGQFYPLDTNGFILPFPGNFRIEGLACIEGLNLTEVRVGEENSTLKISSGLKILKLLANIIEDDYNKIDINVSDLQNVVLTLAGGIEVKLGKGKLSEKLSRLKLVLIDIKDKDLNPAAIDLRFEKVILVPR